MTLLMEDFAPTPAQYVVMKARDEMDARFTALLELLPKTYPEQLMKDVTDFIYHHEYALAVSLLCWAAADTGDYGEGRIDLLALANELGEHDYTPESPHPLP
ncbi:MAG: hypothetical protein EOP83_02060 [Verrucomicrobiaceae bacterium]|nr:MAG: hypothetical protein EOP83_02060 [Verrucomicrobiaceae bacterium]